jgi:hypothetical protein
LATLIQGPAGARCGALGVEDPLGQRGELADLIGAEMREDPPLQSSDVMLLIAVGLGQHPSPLTLTAVSGSTPAESGLASALLNLGSRSGDRSESRSWGRLPPP